MWSGSYRSWSEAIQNTTESNETLVIEQIKSDLLKVKNGEAAYERDGVLYKSTVFGPTCDLPNLAIGEWVFVENFGAYTRAAASTFNGFQENPCFYIMKHN